MEKKRNKKIRTQKTTLKRNKGDIVKEVVKKYGLIFFKVTNKIPNPVLKQFITIPT